MAVTSGFYNSINGDRTYNAEQMSAIFDGIINDGVLANIGKVFQVRVSVSERGIVSVGTGSIVLGYTMTHPVLYSSQILIHYLIE